MSAPVGVFIPAFNAAPYLGQAIESVLGQTFHDLKLVIIDDASTDGTPELVRHYLADRRVTYVRNAANLGMSANWNKGLDLTKGNRFVAKLDADDYYEPEFLARMVEALALRPDIGLAFCACRRVGNASDARRYYTDKWVAAPGEFLNGSLRSFPFFSPTVCVKRACYDKLGGFVGEMRIHSDWEMWTRIAANFGVAYVPETLANYRVHSASCTAQARRDTRSPDDMLLWLRMLDLGQLPYQLIASDRTTLEAAMVKMARGPLYEAIRNERCELVASSARLLLRLRLVPWYERLRYWIILRTVSAGLKPVRLFTVGRYRTEHLWNVERLLQIKLPAANPVVALDQGPV